MLGRTITCEIFGLNHTHCLHFINDETLKSRYIPDVNIALILSMMIMVVDPIYKPSVCVDRMIGAKRGKLGMEEAEKSCRRVAHARNINNNYIHSITTTTTTIYNNNNNKKNTTSVATKNCRRVAHARNNNNNRNNRKDRMYWYID